MTVTDEALARIRAMIVSGELLPGQRLPPEKELGTRLGLSRNSLREAVKALEVVGVLDVRRGDGTFVTALQPAQLMETVSFVLELHRDESLLDVFEVRRILEPAASELAVGRLDPAALDRLRAMLAEVDGTTEVEQLVAHDLAFHAAIVAGAGNEYLTGLLDALGTRTLRARIWRGLTEERSVARTLAEHAAIVDAIVAGDAPLVRALVTVHISGVERWLRRTSGATDGA